MIFFDGHNDFYFPKPHNQWQAYSYSGIKLAQSINDRSMMFVLYTFARSLGDNLFTFKLLEKMFEKFWDKSTQVTFLNTTTDHFSESFDDQQFQLSFNDTVIKTYTQFKALSEFYKFKMIVFLQPEVVFEETSLLSTDDQSIQQITLSYKSGIVEDMKRIKTLIPAIFKQHDIAFFDLSQISSNVTRLDKLYLDYCHLSPAGSKVVADLIATKLWPFIDKDL